MERVADLVARMGTMVHDTLQATKFLLLVQLSNMVAACKCDNEMRKFPYIMYTLTLSCRFSGIYPGDCISPPLVSQGDFSATGQEKDSPISRVIPKKSAA